MVTMRIYDRARSGLDIGFGNDELFPGSSNMSFGKITDRDLGDDRYLVEGETRGSSIYNKMTMLAYMPWDTVYVRAVTLSMNNLPVFELKGINLAEYELYESSDADILAGNDVMMGNKYADRINGFGGNDTLKGFGGNDRISGDLGNDRLEGGSGNDTLNGGLGNDRILGGTGNDSLTGGSGADRFVFYNNEGRDVITDFRNGIDRIAVAGNTHSFQKIKVYDRGADAEIRFDGNIITLKYFDHRQIDAGDFIFA